MPLRNDFDMYSNRGNPTKAKFINAFIKKVKQVEARNQGAKSRVRKPIQLKNSTGLLKWGKSFDIIGALSFGTQ